MLDSQLFSTFSGKWLVLPYEGTTEALIYTASGNQPYLFRAKVFLRKYFPFKSLFRFGIVFVSPAYFERKYVGPGHILKRMKPFRGSKGAAMGKNTPF